MPEHTEWHHHHADKPQHDNEYFERMCRAIFMAGLNWRTLEKKWPGIRKAFQDFDISKVADLGDQDIEALMANPDVIRNLPKIRAVVSNARTMLEVASEYGSFANYLSALRKTGGEDGMRDGVSKRFAFLGKATTVIFLFSAGEDLPNAAKEWEARHQH